MDFYKLTWETNVWSTIEICAELGNIQWYFADHDDTIVLNIDYILDEVTKKDAIIIDIDAPKTDTI